MLYTSLVLSGLLLAAAWLATRGKKDPAGTLLLWLMVIPVGFALLLFAGTALLIQAVVLGVGAPLAVACGGGKKAIRVVALVSFVVGWAVLGISAAGKHREYARLRAEFPLVSMEDRLPRPVPSFVPGDAGRVAELEVEIEHDTSRNRRYVLTRLHETSVDQFAQTSGFGAARMVRMSEPSGRTLTPEPRPDAPTQPDYFNPAPAGEPAKELVRPKTTALESLHLGGVLDFVNPAGFGYVKDRRHVAGFQSHGFSKVPGPAEEWEVARLELVGLLLHEGPVVYRSDKLPRMDELRDAPTRPLDAFEAAALEKLRAGADLHVSETDGTRFLGAVRSAKQCVECHGGERGALLGAFSYRLRPAGKQ